MFETQHLTLFIASGLLLNMTPGQDTLYIVGRSVSQGRRAGLMSVLGISSGCALHTLAAAFGLSAVLATSAQLFTAIKFAGAVYLIFRAGLLTNVLNPKVALFFLAFLPQFVAPSAESRVLPFLFLGAVFVFNGTLWCLVLVWGASAFSRRLRSGSSSGLFVKRAAGALFVALGVRLAVSK